MKPTLQFRLSQHLTLTPQLQQSIRLLQLSTVELNQEIERLLMENPILEREDGESDAAAAGAAAARRGPRSALRNIRGREHGRQPGTQRGASRRLRRALARHRGQQRRRRRRPQPCRARHADAARPPEQRARAHQSRRARPRAGRLLIDALDEDGYLTQPLEEIAALMSAEAEVERRGARDRAAAPAEPRARRRRRALARRVPGAADPRLEGRRRRPLRALALAIAEQHLELLASRDYARLKNVTGADDEALRAAQRLIRGLNPRPGAAFARVETRYVIPDVIVRKVEERLARQPQPRGDAAPAHQPPVRGARRAARAAAATRSPRSCRRRAG